ncbi:MAG: ArsA-related P-loop ATPase, partial [Staphylococcus epidermidis]|nr:ArsA-related P-loop ATPase [Staphylococcus epidermidis]
EGMFVQMMLKSMRDALPKDGLFSSEHTRLYTSNVETLLPKIQNKNLTQMIIVTLAEKTPYLESKRLVEDLNRANIGHNWWVVNQSLVTLNQRDDLFSNKKEDESFWINKIKNESLDNYFVIPYRVLEY